jgi:hypothetical protein
VAAAEQVFKDITAIWHLSMSGCYLTLKDIGCVLLPQVVQNFKALYPSSPAVLVAVTADAFEDTRDR